MCDYCSCRSMPVIEALGADHEALIDCSEDVERAIVRGETDAARRHLAGLVDALRRHDAVEEASVFAALRAAGELLDDVEVLTTEHARTWSDVDDLDRLQGPSWDAAAMRFVTGLRDHIAREEYDLFPATLLAIGPREWDAAEVAAADLRAADAA